MTHHVAILEWLGPTQPCLTSMRCNAFPEVPEIVALQLDFCSLELSRKQGKEDHLAQSIITSSLQSTIFGMSSSCFFFSQKEITDETYCDWETPLQTQRLNPP